MGNHPSGERRGKPGDPYSISRMEGQPFNIDKMKVQKQLVSQFSEEDQAPAFGQVSKSPNEKESSDPIPTRTRPVLDTSKKLLPFVIKWTGGGKDVAVAGTFSQWQPIPMVKSEKDFVVIVDLPEGEHEYKFHVDGEWKVNPSEKACANALGTDNNVLSVKEIDFEELENALLRDPNDKAETPLDKEEYAQEVPENSPNERRKGPPVLPPHLLQVILNKDTPVSCEPTLLPEPHHVMLNHMFALSIRDGMMVLSTTHRYKKKSVTTLIYRPI